MWMCDKKLSGYQSVSGSILSLPKVAIDRPTKQSLTRHAMSHLDAWPIDRKDKLLGNWFSLNALKFQDASKKLLELGGMPLERIPGFLDEVRHSITDRRMRCYYPRELLLCFVPLLRLGPLVDVPFF